MRRKQTFWIPFRLPDLNHALQLSRRRKGPYDPYNIEKQKVQGDIVMAIKQNKIKPVDSCSLVYTWHEPNTRRDPSNIAFAVKYIEDAIVAANVLPNDGWGQIISWDNYFVVDTKHVGCLVEIYESKRGPEWKKSN